MAVYTHVPAEALVRFLAGFDVGTLVSAKGIAEGVENSNYLLDTTGGRFILTLYEKRVAEDDLPFFQRLLAHLAARGVPVPRFIPDRGGRTLHRLQNRAAALIEFLPGISVDRPTAAQARAAGAAMGVMHGALANFPDARPNALDVAGWGALIDRCGPALDSIAPGLEARVASAADAVRDAWPADLPVAAIHADLFPDNVLMRGDAVGGLIDFYFACTDVRAYDLAVMHTAWSFDPAGTPLDRAVGRAIVAGYESTHTLSDAERAALPVLARASCLRFFATRAWDWLNTPADALVTRKDPLAYMRRLDWYDTHGAEAFA